MNEPLISVIMPAKNAERTIEEAIKSVLEQTYSNWELWIIDNHSSDSTKQLAQQYTSDPRIKVLESMLGGVSIARNMGLEQAKGSLLCFLDADDRLPPSSLRKREEKFKDNPEISFVDGYVRFYDENWQHPIRIQQPTLRAASPLPHLLRLEPCCFSGITWMVRWNSPHNLRFDWELTHAEDLLFFARYAALSGEYEYVESPVYDVRIRKNSAMQHIAAQEKAYIKLERKFEELAPDLSWKPEFHKKVRRILFRSYVKQGKLVSAIRVLLRYLRNHDASN